MALSPDFPLIVRSGFPSASRLFSIMIGLSLKRKFFTGNLILPFMAALFGPKALKKISNNHKIYNSFFQCEKGPPTTSFELNGWGDDLVHDYLKAIEINGRIGVLYSNKDYGCEWDYDFRNKRFLAEDNTKFGVNILVYAMGS